MDFVKTAIFLTFFVVAGLCLNETTTLICYDCDPTDNGDECTYPERDNARVTNCQQIANTTAMCLSAYINHTDVKKTGIYRDCVNKPVEVANVCDWYIQETTSANVTFQSCFPCNEDRCNKILLYSDGSSSTNDVYNTNALMLINTIILTALAMWL